MELLRGRLELHYRRMKNFIRTTNEPAVFWLPAKHTDATKDLLKNTQAIIDKKMSSLQIELQPLPETQSVDEGGDDNLSVQMEDENTDPKTVEKKDTSDGEVDEDEMQDILAAADA
eukprot:Platyproteum_vivax@DN6520_c1_g1_i1.p2